jgi:hypothetical protein
MIKSIISVLALSASTLAFPGGRPDQGLPECKDAPKSCDRLPAKSTKACQASIKQLGLAVATCADPTSVQIVTVTQTAKPRDWKTTTTQLTSTSVLTEHYNVTVSSTVVQTNYATVTNTVTASAYATITNTNHVNITSTKVVSAINTITSTQIKDQSKETCAAAGSWKRDLAFEDVEKRGRNQLPDDCSCFLTATTWSGVKTYSTTVTSTPTIVVTKVVPAKSTVTQTWTITKPVTSKCPDYRPNYCILPWEQRIYHLDMSMLRSR